MDVFWVPSTVNGIAPAQIEVIGFDVFRGMKCAVSQFAGAGLQRQGVQKFVVDLILHGEQILPHAGELLRQDAAATRNVVEVHDNIDLSSSCLNGSANQ